MVYNHKPSEITSKGIFRDGEQVASFVECDECQDEGRFWVNDEYRDGELVALGHWKKCLCSVDAGD